MISPSEHQAFMAAVVAATADDLPRLVYADRLDEDGDPLGEFVRVQIELAKCPPEVRADRRWYDHRYLAREPWDTLRRRERKLFRDIDPWRWCEWARTQDNGQWTLTCNAHLPAFRVGLSEATQNIWHNLNRGFPDGIGCDWDDWVRYEGAIRRSCPVLEVHLGNSPPFEANRRPDLRCWQISVNTGREPHPWYGTEDVYERDLLAAGSRVKAEAVVMAAAHKLLAGLWAGIEFSHPWPLDVLNIAPRACRPGTRPYLGVGSIQ